MVDTDTSSQEKPRFSSKHIVHGVLFILAGLYALGVHTVVSPEGEWALVGGWGTILSVVLIGFGLFLIVRRRGVIDRLTVSVEYYDAIVMAVGIALVARTFVVEPFKIPSGSMIPTLLVGDYLFVQKYAYGYRIPFARARIAKGEGPTRGDVAVFKFPQDPSKDFIKRIIGLPGDRIQYDFSAKRLTVNGQAVSYKTEPTSSYVRRREGSDAVQPTQRLEELKEKSHPILVEPPSPFTRSGSGLWEIPAGHYFVMGDNRDNSNDGRSWGYVPEYQLVGKAVKLFWSWDHIEGSVRWDRVWQTIL